MYEYSGGPANAGWASVAVAVMVAAVILLLGALILLTPRQSNADNQAQFGTIPISSEGKPQPGITYQMNEQGRR